VRRVTIATQRDVSDPQQASRARLAAMPMPSSARLAESAEGGRCDRSRRFTDRWPLTFAGRTDGRYIAAAYGRLTIRPDKSARIAELLALPARRVGPVRHAGSRRRDEDLAPATRQKLAGASRVRRFGGGTHAHAARAPATSRLGSAAAART